MIDLYGMSSPNVFKVSIMLEEIGLPYNIKYISVYKGDQYKPEFLAIGPNNKVPVIVDSDGPDGKPFPVFESGAILIYLAEKTGMLLSADPAERSVTLQWLMMQMSSVGPMIGQLNHFLRLAPEVNEYAITRYTSEMRRILDVLETRLSQRPYLAGKAYSIADIAVLPWLRVAFAYLPPFHGKPTIEACAEYPNLSRWFHKLLERPGVKRGIAQLEAVVFPKDAETYEQADKDDIDKYLGRGKHVRGRVHFIDQQHETYNPHSDVEVAIIDPAKQSDTS